jgi:hypothetical protein
MFLELVRLEHIEGFPLPLVTFEAAHYFLDLGDYLFAEEHAFFDRTASVGIDANDRRHLKTAGKKKQHTTGNEQSKQLHKQPSVLGGNNGCEAQRRSVSEARLPPIVGVNYP